MTNRLRLILLAILFLFAAQQSEAQMHQGREIVKASLIADTAAVVPGKPFTVGLLMKMEPHWHTYWQYGGDSGMPTRIDWKLPPGFTAGEIQWPMPGKILEDDLLTYGYSDEVLLMVTITPPAKVSAGEVRLQAKASWLTCEKICIPGDADLELALPVKDEAEGANAPLFEKYRAQLPKRENLPFPVTWAREGNALILTVQAAQPVTDFFPLPAEGVLIGHPEVSANRVRIPLEQGGEVQTINGVVVVGEGTQREAWELAPSVAPTAARGQSAESETSLAYWLLLGFIGGLILNVMPCVLPVIGLKIFGFIKQAGESKQKILRLGLSFVAGIFAWFLAIAGLLIAFQAAGKELNWAFQFQHPAFLIGMIVIILVFGLNLLGVFEIFLPSRTQTRIVDLSAREGYGGAFLHGVFATLMATPCTAPFLGPALGFALAQSGTVIFAMFTAIAAGMSFPYLLLAVNPGWLKFLPKPGMWMVRLKHFFGVLLLGTVAWLGWVLWQQQTVVREPFAPQFEKALATDKIVFVDFTADWCVNCKVNERLVLNTEAVQGEFKKRDVFFLKADWTNGDPDITKVLKQYGRAGVPFYLVYPKDRKKEPLVLPELLTKEIVMESLTKADE